MADISKIKLPQSEQAFNIKDSYARELIAALPKSMQFKGSLGTNGTITSLPVASVNNEGFVYKVITSGTYQGISAKVGDTFISGFDVTGKNHEWVLIPSGDEPTGTVTNVATGTGLTGGPITTSGTISVDTNVIATKDFAKTVFQIDTVNKTIKCLGVDITEDIRTILADGRSLFTVN